MAKYEPISRLGFIINFNIPHLKRGMRQVVL